MDPAFFRPMARLWLAASAARNLMKSTESDSRRLRPLSLSYGEFLLEHDA
jgi:hypothetical protein